MHNHPRGNQGDHALKTVALQDEGKQPRLHWTVI